jgi:hypothetical protein
MNDNMMAWAAGLFEGEGSIWFDRKTVRMGLNTTDEDVIKKFHEIVGVGSVIGPFHKNINHKPFFRWNIAKRIDVANLLHQFIPYLMSRRRAKAQEALNYLLSLP